MKLHTLLVLLSALFIIGCTAQTDTIGWMGPLTGDAASYGESIQRGVQLAQETSENTYSVLYEDSKCDGKEAANAMTKLATIDQVPAVIGEVCSGATLAAAPIAQQHKVVMISASSTSPELTNNSWVFRTIPSDALQGAYAAQLIADDGHSTVAVLHGNEEYGIGLADSLQEAYSGEVVAREAFQRGSVDMRTQLTKIAAQNPQALYIISNSPDSAVAALTQAQEIGLQAAIYGSEGLKSPDVVQGAGQAAEGLIVTSVTSGSDEFAQQHLQRFGEEPGPFAAQAHDAYVALQEAINLGATTGADIREVLTSVSFQGASGEIGFDENGDLTQGNFDVSIVEDGAFVEVE